MKDNNYIYKDKFILDMNKEIQFLMYSTPQGDVNVEAVVRDETLWLTQKAMAQLFGVDRSVISKHLNNVFDESELDKEVVCAKFAHTTQHGAIEGKTQTQEVQFYNLFLKDASSLPFKVEITNVPEDIQAMITSVSKTQTKVKTIRPTSNVLNFENVDDLLKYMSTVAF